jgi:NRPS condensation-like uncharacterized protein
MPENVQVKKYERKLTHVERMFFRLPYAIVTVVARIKGHVSEGTLTNAVSQVQQRHPNLRVRIRVDDNHDPWFTSQGAKEIAVEIVDRESDDHWIEVYHEACRVPFEFEERPAIRFILVQSPNVSELVIFCHHTICDGMSLAYLARDLMVHLGDPTRQVDVLPDPVPIDIDTIPKEVSFNAIVRFLLNRMNEKWEKEKIFFDQRDYVDLNQAYWMNARHQMLPVELSEAQTSALVERCREEKVTVNTALTAAFAGAQSVVQSDKRYHSNIGVAGSLRDRLQRPAGQVMGFYAGAVTLKYKYDGKTNFWANARRLHRKITPLYTDKNLFGELLVWCYLAPGILESMCFKMVGELVPSHFARYDKLSAFSQRDDVVSSILKREKMDSLDKILMGMAVTNLTRVDFPDQYGTLELDRLIMNPGGAYPLTMINLVLGAVTCAGKLSLLLEYAEETVDTNTMAKIRDQAIEFLLSE